MNDNHACLCPSPEWADHLQRDVLPRAIAGATLGREMLEVGPGPGASTDWLRRRVDRLLAVEVDPDAAEALRRRFAGTNVEVVDGDGTALPLEDGSVDSVGTFTMLHHVPTNRLQDRLLAEAHRVLRPGGVLVGSDSLPSDGLHHFHVDDTYNPVEPAALLVRLRTIGFDQVTVAVGREMVFTATKAAGAD